MEKYFLVIDNHLFKGYFDDKNCLIDVDDVDIGLGVISNFYDFLKDLFDEMTYLKMLGKIQRNDIISIYDKEGLLATQHEDGKFLQLTDRCFYYLIKVRRDKFFDIDIYDTNKRISFLDKVREESIQISKDIERQKLTVDKLFDRNEDLSPLKK